jgi:predicted NAD/FAD-dependent oxidoreductase
MSLSYEGNTLSGGSIDDVLIVGGGLAGLALAGHLTRQAREPTVSNGPRSGKRAGTESAARRTDSQCSTNGVVSRRFGDTRLLPIGSRSVLQAENF